MAQQQAAKKDEKKRSKQEQAEIEQVVKLVDGVMAGQPAPTDITMTLEPFFMKSQEQRTFVPFVLTVTDAPKADAAMYVRVVNPAADARPEGEEGRVPLGRHPLHPGGAAGQRQRQAAARLHGHGGHLRRLHRLQGAPAGEGAEDARCAKIGVLKTQVTVPDSITASSHELHSRHRQGEHADRGDRPRRGARAAVRVRRAGIASGADMDFKKTEELSIFFQVYNSGLDQGGKPNMTLEYEFHKDEGDRREVLQQDQPADRQRAPTCRRQFDPAKFPVPGGITVPLASFAEGSYRLRSRSPTRRRTRP